MAQFIFIVILNERILYYLGMSHFSEYKDDNRFPSYFEFAQFGLFHFVSLYCSCFISNIPGQLIKELG